MTVPRVVHRIWVGGGEPDWTRQFAQTWERPGWRICQWIGPGELYPLRNQDLYDRAEELFPDHVGQFRSDLLRYEVLYRYGGVYADCDFELLRPIDDLIEGAMCFATYERQDGWIANGLMGATANHPFVHRLIEGISRSVEARPGQRPNRVTGPQYLTRMNRAHNGLDVVLPQNLFFPFGWDEAAEHNSLAEDTGDCVARHWWANQRRERNLPCPQ